MNVPAALVESFISSEMGLHLGEVFPVGTMHRGNLAYLVEWQKKYRPVPKRRTPKHRRRK